MPAAPEKEFDVLAYFHAKDPKTGQTVFYHPDPDGGDGWPGARKTFKGDPGSDRVKELLNGVPDVHPPLIGEKKTTSTSGKES